MLGCSSTRAEAPAAPAHPTQAPDVPRLPRADLLAVAAGRLVRVEGSTLRIGEAAVEAPEVRGVCGLPDGRVVVLVPGSGALRVGVVTPSGDASWSDTFLPLTSGPLTVLCDPEGGAFWRVDAARRSADHLGLVPVAGRIVADRHVDLGGDSASDVAVLADGALLVSVGNRLTRIGADGVAAPLAWRAEGPIERVAADAAGGAWVLPFAGPLVHLDASGAVLATVPITGRGVALAVDGEEVAVVTATWSQAERNRWSVRLLGVDGATRWAAEGDPAVTERGLVIAADRVVFGGPGGVRAWARADGAPLP